MGWVKDKVFSNADDFLVWLDENFGDYITKHISEQHTHHTWKPDHSSYPKYTTLQLHKNMRNFHVNTNGWDDIAQNITIGKDGDIITGRDIRVIPISAKGYNGSTNWHPFAYEMIGNFDIGHDKLEGKQLESAIKISRYFYNKGKDIKFHRELLLNGRQPKTCPGTGIEKDWLMSLVKNSNYDVGVSPSLQTQVGTKVETTPNPPSSSTTIESYVGKRVECIYSGNDGVNFYSKPTWDKNYKVGVLTKGLGFPTILDKINVDGSYQYKVKNSKGDVYYVTASTIYVKVEGESKPVSQPTSSHTSDTVVLKKRYIQLPSSADTWRVYPLDKTPIKGNEKGLLAPKRFGGLNYEILKDRGNHVYEIQTSSFGRVQIYGSPSTGANIILK